MPNITQSDDHDSPRVAPQAREERGLSIRQLAEASGCGQGRISRMESGETKSRSATVSLACPRHCVWNQQALPGIWSTRSPQDCRVCPSTSGSGTSPADEAVADLEYAMSRSSQVLALRPSPFRPSAGYLTAAPRHSVRDRHGPRRAGTWYRCREKVDGRLGMVLGFL